MRKIILATGTGACKAVSELNNLNEVRHDIGLIEPDPGEHDRFFPDDLLTFDDDEARTSKVNPEVDPANKQRLHELLTDEINLSEVEVAIIATTMGGQTGSRLSQATAEVLEKQGVAIVGLSMIPFLFMHRFIYANARDAQRQSSKRNVICIYG